MIYDVQKASMLKRISAWLLDIILLLVLTVGLGALISLVSVGIFGLVLLIDLLVQHKKRKHHSL